MRIQSSIGRLLGVAPHGTRGTANALFLLVFCFGFVTTGLSPAGLAETRSSALVGVVRGPSGQTVRGASVLLTREGAFPLRFETTTDADGRFTLEGLPSGSYSLELAIAGRASYRQTHLAIRSASTLELEIAIPAAALQARPSPPAVLDRGVWWGTPFSELSTRKLPHARNLWSLLENQEPSTATDRIDVGGLQTGEPALFGALGASWTENQYVLNGFNVTDASLPGRPLFDPDVDALEEFQFITAAKPARSSGSGATLELSTPVPPESFHVSARLFYSGRSLQSDNMNSRLRGFNFPGPERFNHLWDGSVQLGGMLPVKQAAWPFLVSLSTQQLSKNLGGFGLPIDARVYRALAEFSPISRGTRRWDIFDAVQHRFEPHEGADARVSPDSTTRGTRNFHQLQTRWTENVNPWTFFSLGFGFAHAIVSSGLQSGLRVPATLDLPEMLRRGPATLDFAGVSARYEINSLLQTLRGHAAGNHSLTLGFDWERSSILNRWNSLGGIEQVLVRGAGSEVTRWNTPTEARQHVQNFGLFFEDAWRPANWLRLPLGVRLDSTSGRASGVARGIRWTSLQPRAGLVLSLTQRGPVVRASWSRYAHLMQGRYLDFGNPSALGGEVFRWQDANGDGVAEPAEIANLLREFGGPFSAIDRRLARPFTDEISVGLDQDFERNFQASVRFFRRDAHRLIALKNIGVPLSSYTPVAFADPGNDGVPGTADDQLLTLYNRDASALGQDFLLLANPPGHHASFKGFEVRLTRPLRVWEFSASFTAMRTLAATNPGNSVFENDPGFVGSLGTDPNTYAFASSRTYFDRAFIGKATAFYFAPRAFQLGAVVKYYDGLPFGRLLFVEGFHQGPFFVRATPRAHPGGFQTQFNFTLDVRVAREFALRRGKLSGYLDFFNVLNLNKNTLEADLTGPTFESRVPLAIEAPRTARLGIEWKF